MKYLRSAKLRHKTVLLRVDVNVPMSGGRVADDFRLRQIIPTIRLLQEEGNTVIVCGHLGRPEGRVQSELSLRPVASALANLLGYKFVETERVLPDYSVNHLVFYTGNIMEDRHQEELGMAPAKDVVFLENLRFYPGEETNDPVFAKKLSGFAEIFVNDAFGADHRSSASTVGVAKRLPSYCGLLLEKEIKAMDLVLKKAAKPFVLVMGGIKISDKVETLKYLGEKADRILLGGGLANLFFKSRGYDIGLSKAETAGIKAAWEIDRNFKGKICLPSDVVVADAKMDKNTIRVTEPHSIGEQEAVYDIGPKTILAYANDLKPARTVVWNGPLGLFEAKPFDTGTLALARVVGGISSRKAYGVVGGGETVDAIRLAGQLEHMDHVSTGGGAMLEYLAGKHLPGIEALS